MKIFFRVDFSNKIGFGHIKRCLSIIEQNNFLGYEYNFQLNQSRLSGLFGSELIAGYFLLGFSMLVFSYLYQIVKLSKINLILVIIGIIIISLMIGERSNFIKLLIGICIMAFLILKISLTKKILIFFLISFFSVVLISSNETYKSRFYDQVKKIVSKNGIEKYLKKSQYGAHYNTAYQIYEKNKLRALSWNRQSHHHRHWLPSSLRRRLP